MATIVKSTASPAEIPLFLGAPQPTKSPTSLLADLRGLVTGITLRYNLMVAVLGF
jgi:hypothetical protein